MNFRLELPLGRKFYRSYSIAGVLYRRLHIRDHKVQATRVLTLFRVATAVLYRSMFLLVEHDLLKILQLFLLALLLGILLLRNLFFHPDRVHH